MVGRSIEGSEEGFFGFSERDLDGLLGTFADQSESDFFAALLRADEEGKMLGRNEPLILEPQEDVVTAEACLVRGGVGHDFYHLDAEAFRDFEVLAEGGIERMGGNPEPGPFAGHFPTGRMTWTRLAWFGSSLASSLGSPGFFAGSLGSTWLFLLRRFSGVIGPGSRCGKREREENREKNGNFHFLCFR
jgi:hypothetical protein